MRGVYGYVWLLGSVFGSLSAIVAAGPSASAAEDGLSAPVHATWRNLSLSAVVDRIAAIIAMPVIVDRRIDPTTRITLEADGDSVASLLDRIAERTGSEWVPLDASVRIVPRGLAGRLASADAARASLLARLPASERTALRESRPMAWEAGVPPGELVRRLAAEGRFSVEELDRLPHDHLPAASLVPMPLADRLDLVLAHYDLRIDRSGSPRSLRIVPLGEAIDGPAPTRTHRPGRADAAVRVDRYTLRTEAPLDELLRTLAAKFGLELAIDRGSLAGKGIAPGVIVKLSVEDASREALLDAILKSRGLEWSIDGERLNVR